MTKASDNIYPSMLYAEGTTPSSPSAGQQRLFVRSSDHVLCMVNSSGTVTPLSGSLTNPMTTKGDVILGDTSGVPSRLGAGTSGYALTSNGAGAFPSWQAAAAAAGALLGVKSYATGGSLAATSGTLIDADATNLAVAFTAPASTNVIVRLTGTMRTNASSGERVIWGLRESTTVIAGGNSAGQYVGFATGSTILEARSVAFLLSGISAGSHTYKWAIGCTASSGGLYLDASNPALMEVLSAP